MSTEMLPQRITDRVTPDDLQRFLIGASVLITTAERLIAAISGVETTPFDRILDAVAATWSTNRKAILSRSKEEQVNYARQAAMALARELLGMSPCAIGRELRRNHGAVLHGLRAVADRRDVDRRFAARYAAAKSLITAHITTP